MYSKRVGNCDVISGLYYPKYDSCLETAVTTTTTTTTTESAPSSVDTIKLTWHKKSINLDLHLVLFNGNNIECEMYINDPICDGAVISKIPAEVSSYYINNKHVNHRDSQHSFL